MDITPVDVIRIIGGTYRLASVPVEIGADEWPGRPVGYRMS
jgi:hypothetical protein